MRKKRTGKRSKVSTKSLKPQDLIPAYYNPRVMDDKAAAALEHSMSEFNDISGITWNKRTSNIVTGHHRWQNLINIYGIEKLQFTQLSEDKYSIFTGDKDTGFILRVVDWDEAKEKAANITANSQKVEGTFTNELQGVLDDIKMDMDDELFGNLRLDELNVSIADDKDGAFGEPDWDTDIDDVEGTVSNLDGIITTVKIECAQEIRSEIFKIVSHSIESSEFKGKAQVK